MTVSALLYAMGLGPSAILDRLCSNPSCGHQAVRHGRTGCSADLCPCLAFLGAPRGSL